MDRTKYNLSVVLLASVTALVIGITVFSSAAVADAAAVNASGPTSVEPGETVTLSITVTNTASDGGAYIANISPPAGWRVVSHSDDGGIWNQEDRAWLWQQIGAESTTNPSVTLTVPSNASGGSYTITSNVLSKDGVEATTEHTVVISDSDNNDGGSTNAGVTAGGGVPPSSTERTENSSAEPIETTNRTANGRIEATIEDSDPERDGVTVQFASSTVKEVTFNDDYSGTVEVRRYNEPSAEIIDEISRRLAEDAALGESENEDSTNDSSQTASKVSVISLTDISPSSEAATQAAATVQFTVDQNQLDKPENVVVVHRNGDGWEQLETRVVNIESSEVTVEAATDSFSLFAVVETRSEGTSQSEGKDGSNEPALPVLLSGSLIAALLLGGTILWMRT